MENNGNKPFISIIMPVFNGEAFVAEAIKSILNQTYQNFEFIIINDASTDQTEEIITKFKKQYPYLIKVFSLNKNKGAFGAVNQFFKKAKGEFIALVDSDDLSFPQRLEKELEFLLSHPQVIVVGGQAKIINEKGLVIGKKVLPTSDFNIKRDFAFVHPMIHPSCMIRKELLPKTDYLYEDKFGVNDDYYTFFKLLSFGEFANLEDVIISYRIHQNNSSLKNIKRTLINTVRIRLAARKNFGYHLTIKAWLSILTQSVIFFLIPKKFILKFYLLFRGIYLPEDLFGKKLLIFKSFLAKPIHYCFSVLSRES